MDLAKLEADIHELERRYKQWDANLVCLIEDRLRTLEGETYTEADRKREINILYRQQLAVYNPRLAERPLLNEVIAAFPSLPADEREATRNIFAKFLLSNIWTRLRRLRNSHGQPRRAHAPRARECAHGRSA